MARPKANAVEKEVNVVPEMALPPIKQMIRRINKGNAIAPDGSRPVEMIDAELAQWHKTHDITWHMLSDEPTAYIVFYFMKARD